MNSNFSTATTAGRGVSGHSSSSNRKRRNASSNSTSSSSSSLKSTTTIFRKYSRKYCVPLLLVAIGIIGFIQISMYNIVLHNHSHNNGLHTLLSPYQQRKYFEEERLKRKEQQETKIQQLQHRHNQRPPRPVKKPPIKSISSNNNSNSDSDVLSSSLRHHQKPQQMKMRKEPKMKVDDVNKKEDLQLELEDVDIHLIRQQKQQQHHEHQIIKNDNDAMTNSSTSRNITPVAAAAAAVAAAEEEEEEDNNNEQKQKEKLEHGHEQEQEQEQEQERVLQKEYDSDNSPDNSNSNSNKIIHIIHTRFMQHYRYTNNTKGNNTNNQGNTNTTATNYLTILGQARLKQFLTFCLPTIQKQTNQNFLWIIKIDPLLAVSTTATSNKSLVSNAHKLIFQPLIDAINNVTIATGQNNIYIVGSNYNYNIEGHGGSWRDGQEGEELLSISLPTTSLLYNNTTTTTTSMTSNSSNTTTNVTVPFAKLAKVYTGDMVKLRKAYDLREKLPILETRLDADDGLQYQYIERIQTIAIQRFLGSTGIDIDSNSGNVASSLTTTTNTNTTTTMTRSMIHNDTNSTTDVGAAAAAAAAAVPDSLLLQQQQPKPKWLYWCIQTQMEWHSDINTTATNSYYYYGSPEKGYVSAVSNQKYCITPGVTIGYNIGINGMDVPQYQHTKLWSELHSKKAYCHDIKDKHHPISKGPCLIVMGSTTSTSTSSTSASNSSNSASSNNTDTDTDTVNNNNSNNNESQMILHAIRSRTLTSAGMNGIFVTNNNNNNNNNSNNDTDDSTFNNTASTTTKMEMLRRSNKKSKSQQEQTQETQEQKQQQRMEDLLWKLLYYEYGIEFNRIIDTQHFLTQNSRQIAYENWLGQCSHGHSCKRKAKNDLDRIINNSVA